MKPKYKLHVNLQPTNHDGGLAYFWRIIIITDDGEFNVAHGYHKEFTQALAQAHTKAHEMKLVNN